MNEMTGMDKTDGLMLISNPQLYEPGDLLSFKTSLYFTYQYWRDNTGKKITDEEQFRYLKGICVSTGVKYLKEPIEIMTLVLSKKASHSNRGRRVILKCLSEIEEKNVLFCVKHIWNSQSTSISINHEEKIVFDHNLSKFLLIETNTNS